MTRFISISGEDIFRSILDNSGTLTNLHPENVKLLRLDYLLGREYGVDINQAIDIIADVLFEFISDTALTIPQIREICTELYRPIIKRNSHQSVYERMKQNIQNRISGLSKQMDKREIQNRANTILKDVRDEMDNKDFIFL